MPLINLDILKPAERIYKDTDITDDDIKPNKLGIIFINYNYGGGENYLGQPVINDAALFIQHVICFGYKCFYICDTDKETAIKIIIKLISLEGKDIVFFYAGHGTQVVDISKDEDDGFDEAFCFPNSDLFIDDEFCDIVNKYMKCNKFICMTDACHSGTIYDVERIDVDKQKHMICLSACTDSQCATQYNSGNGVFSINFWKCFDMETKTLDVKRLGIIFKNSKLNQMPVIYPTPSYSTMYIDF